jgi:hypothetical protein
MGNASTTPVGLAIVTGLTLVLSQPVAAQQYPSKPVRVVVPFAPGGGSDATARQFSAKLSALLGQQFVVENRGGRRSGWCMSHASSVITRAGSESSPRPESKLNRLHTCDKSRNPAGGFFES